MSANKGLSSKQRELYQRVDEVLHYIWDPIGIANEPCARDEYHDYLPHVFSLLMKTCDGSKIVEYLSEVERDSMRSKPNINKLKELTEILLGYKEEIFNGKS